MPEPGAPVRLAMRLDCGHAYAGPDLLDRVTYDEDDDRLIVRCAKMGCGYVQPARGSRNALAELYHQVGLRMTGEAIARMGSLWEARKVLDREPVPYAGHIETGTRAHASTPYVKPVKPRPKTWAERMAETLDQAKEADEHFVDDWDGNPLDESPPWLLRLDLWWMRLCLRWQTGDGVRLDIRVPTVTAP